MSMSRLLLTSAMNIATRSMQRIAAVDEESLSGSDVMTLLSLLCPRDEDTGIVGFIHTMECKCFALLPGALGVLGTRDRHADRHRAQRPK